MEQTQTHHSVVLLVHENFYSRNYVRDTLSANQKQQDLAKIHGGEVCYLDRTGHFNFIATLEAINPEGYAGYLFPTSQAALIAGIKMGKLVNSLFPHEQLWVVQGAKTGENNHYTLIYTPQCAMEEHLKQSLGKPKTLIKKRV